MAKNSFYGSLARRIFLITIVLIVIPMVIFSILSWQRDWRIRLSSALSELELMGNMSEQVYKDWVSAHSNGLLTLAAIIKNEADFEKVGSSESLATVFVIEDGHFKNASSEAMRKQPVFFQEKGVFIAPNPYTKQKEVFLLKKIKDATWGLSVSLSEFAKRFQLAGDSMKVTFIDKNSELNSFDQIVQWKKNLKFKEIQLLKGKDLTFEIPLEGAAFNLKIKMPRENAGHVQGRGFFAHILLFFAIFVLVGTLGAIWLVSRMARPLNQLYGLMNAIEVKDYTKRYMNDRFGFEINLLGQNFNQMLDVLLKNMEEAKNERVARERLARELDIGHEIQKELLPKKIPQFPGLKIGQGFIPAKEVGGDFYDLFALDDEHLFLSIADGSDKGISACLYSLIVRSMLRSHALEKNDLKKIVLMTNDLFCRDTGMSGNFVTAWLAIFNKKNKTLQYTSAGHLPAIMMEKNGMIEELYTKGIALGVQKEIEVEVKSKVLLSGSLLFLYTDGLIEAHNEKGELFEKSRLIEFLKGHRDLESQDLIDTLFSVINQFSNKVPQHDDLTALSIKTEFSDRF